MPEFSRGVKEYIRAHALVEVTFPVDFRDNAEVNCYQCKILPPQLPQLRPKRGNLRVPRQIHREPLPPHFLFR